MLEITQTEFYSRIDLKFFPLKDADFFQISFFIPIQEEFENSSGATNYHLSHFMNRSDTVCSDMNRPQMRLSMLQGAWGFRERRKKSKDPARLVMRKSYLSEMAQIGHRIFYRMLSNCITKHCYLNVYICKK